MSPTLEAYKFYMYHRHRWEQFDSDLEKCKCGAIRRVPERDEEECEQRE